MQIPVKPDAEHPVGAEGGDEQVDVLGSLPVLGQRTLSEGDGAHPAAVPVPERLLSAVAAPQPRPLRQDELQLRRGPARNEGPDQRQRILVEVGGGHE